MDCIGALESPEIDPVMNTVQGLHTCKKIMDLDLKDRDHLSDLDLLV